MQDFRNLIKPDRERKRETTELIVQSVSTKLMPAHTWDSDQLDLITFLQLSLDSAFFAKGLIMYQALLRKREDERGRAGLGCNEGTMMSLAVLRGAMICWLGCASMALAVMGQMGCDGGDGLLGWAVMI